MTGLNFIPESISSKIKQKLTIYYRKRWIYDDKINPTAAASFAENEAWYIYVAKFVLNTIFLV